jgi:succinate-acetate transporter protein
MSALGPTAVDDAPVAIGTTHANGASVDNGTSATSSASAYDKEKPHHRNPALADKSIDGYNGTGENRNAQLNSDVYANSPSGAARYPDSQQNFRRFGNPTPLGLSAFALTTFLLSLINMQTLNIVPNNIVISAAFAYGGLVQLLAGMWEMAAGNTFAATALSSYGGFWIAFAIIGTPAFQIGNAYANSQDLDHAIGLFLISWFIFTFILLICTLRSSIALFILFFTLDLAFLLLAIAQLQLKNDATNVPVLKAGGFFGLLSAFTAWYCALAGLTQEGTSFIVFPLGHFPWSVEGRRLRAVVQDTV